MPVEGSSVSGAEVVIIDAERLVVLARALVDDQGGFVVSVPQRPSYWLGVSGPYMIWQPTLTRRSLLRERP